MPLTVEKKKKLNSVMDSINKTYGDGVIGTAKQKEKELALKRLSTGSIEANLALYGGALGGRIIEIYGPESSGKTSLAETIAAKQQEINKNYTVGFFETEDSFDKDYAEMLGVDTDRLIYWDQRNVSAEQGFDILRALVASQEVNMIIVNSVSGLCPSAESNGKMEDTNIGLTARMMSKLMRVLSGQAAKYNVTVIFINQVRDKISFMGGEDTPGGRALKFYSSQRIRLSKVKIDPKTDGIPPKYIDQYMKIHGIVKKNRGNNGGNPYKMFDYFVKYGKGINNIIQYPKILLREKMIEGSKWLYYPSKENPAVIGGEECKWDGKKALMKSIMENKELKKTFDKLLEEKQKKGAGNDLSQEEIEKIKEEEEETEKEEKKLIKEEKKKIKAEVKSDNKKEVKA